MLTSMNRASGPSAQSTVFKRSVHARVLHWSPGGAESQDLKIGVRRDVPITSCSNEAKGPRVRGPGSPAAERAEPQHLEPQRSGEPSFSSPATLAPLRWNVENTPSLPHPHPPTHPPTSETKRQAALQAPRGIKVSQYSCVGCCRPARHAHCTPGRY